MAIFRNLSLLLSQKGVLGSNFLKIQEDLRRDFFVFTSFLIESGKVEFRKSNKGRRREQKFPPAKHRFDQLPTDSTNIIIPHLKPLITQIVWKLRAL